jgi:hypothetical protein
VNPKKLARLIEALEATGYSLVALNTNGNRVTLEIQYGLEGASVKPLENGAEKTA